MKKTVLILYTSHDAGPETPFSDTKYQHCYEALYTLGEAMGLHLCRAPLAWYDSEQDIFQDSWEFVAGSWRRSGPVKPDLVYDKTSGASAQDVTRTRIISRYLFVDDPAFTLFANDKYRTSQLLPEHFKSYKKISTLAEFSDFLDHFSGKLLVVKPVVGSGGKGVHIVSKEEAHELDLSFPIIAQEFIDSSHGIPGITDTYHDLRMVFIGDELVYSYVRTPKEGSLLANLAQGGRMHIVPTKDLPASLQPIIRDTKKLFAPFPEKTYTIDVMFDTDERPWIIEYNTMPGMFFPPEESATMLRVYKRLLEELQKPLQLKRTSLITALIIFTSRGDEQREAFQKEEFREAYTHFARLAEKENVHLYRASVQWYDALQTSFHSAWHWDGSNWILTHGITPDVIYDKAATTPEALPIKEVLAKHFPFVNSLDFSTHAGSKFLVSQAFAKFTKPYFRVTSLAELANATKKIAGTKLVIKPERGNSGEGIFILDKTASLKQEFPFPLLVQEFIDSSAGIPGVMQGLHDLRLIFSQTDFIYAYYRTPKAGSLLANLAQGGTQTMVAEEAIPHPVWPIIEAVQNFYAKFPEKIYTVDLMFDPAGQPWIVEMNTMPGLYPDVSEQPHIEKLYRAILHTLKRVASKK